MDRPFIGRTYELDLLTQLYDQITQDQGQIAAVVGEAGIGKSRLVQEFKTWLKEQKSVFSEGSFSSRSGVHEYQALAQVIENLCAFLKQSPEQFLQGPLEQKFIRLITQTQDEIHEFEEMTDEEIQNGIFNACRKFFHKIAAHPLVLIFEDVDFASENSLRLIERLIDGIESTRLLIILLHRENLNRLWSTSLNYSEIKLIPLSEDELQKFLLKTTTADQVASRLKKELYQKSRGNPLFAEEMLRRLFDAKDVELEDCDGQRILRLKTQSIKEIPDSLYQLIRARFESLDAESRSALQWASLLGEVFDVEEWEALVKKSTDQIPSLAQHLFQTKYLREESEYPCKQYRFEHGLIFEVVLSTHEKESISEKNLVIAKLLESLHPDAKDINAVRIADHFFESGSHKQPTVHWGTEAGKFFMRHFSYPKAQNYFQKTWTLIQKEPSSFHAPEGLFRGWLRSCLSLGDTTSAQQSMNAWRKSIQPGAETGDYLLACAEFSLEKGDYYLALENAEEAVEYFQKKKERESRLLRAEECRLHALSRLGLAQEFFEQGLDLVQRLKDRHLEVQFRIWVHLCHEAVLKGKLSQGRDYLDKARSIGLTHISPSDQMNYYERVIPVFEESLDYPGAIRHLSDAAKVAEESGMQGKKVFIQLQKGSFYQKMGLFRQAYENIQDASSLAERLKHEHLIKRTYYALVDFYLSVGANQEAQELFKSLKLKGSDETELSLDVGLKGFEACLKLRSGAAKDAARIHQDIAELYTQTGHQDWAYRHHAMALAIQDLHHLKPHKDIYEQFKRLHLRMKDSQLFLTQIHGWIAALCVFAQTKETQEVDPKRFKPNEIRPYRLQRLAYAALVSFYKKQEEAQHAQTLGQEFFKTQESLLPNVPKEFLEAFKKQPLSFA